MQERVILDNTDIIIQDWLHQFNDELKTYTQKLELDTIPIEQYLEYPIYYLSYAIRLEDPTIFRHFVNWTFTVLEARGIPNMLIKNLFDQFEKIVLNLPLDSSKSLISSIFEAVPLNEKHKNFADGSFLEDFDNVVGETSKYLEILLGGSRKEAMDYIEKIRTKGNLSDQQIIIRIIQPAQYEIGRLWQFAKISIATEHLITAINQSVFAMIYYGSIFQDIDKDAKTIVTVCLGTELHEFGARIIADFFTLAGYNSIFLGSNLPTSEFLENISSYNPDVIALSATMINSVNEIEKFIHKLRSDGKFHGKIIVGGYVFKIDKNLWKIIGADGFASDGFDAMKTVNEWLSEE